jgi:hypothetical protein
MRPMGTALAAEHRMSIDFQGNRSPGSHPPLYSRQLDGPTRRSSASEGLRRPEPSRSHTRGAEVVFFTCEYCFSHWVTLALMVMTGHRLLLDDWRER